MRLSGAYGTQGESFLPLRAVLAVLHKIGLHSKGEPNLLSSNTGAAKVYYTSGTPDVILMETSWFTAPVGENSETQHRGFNVYILYDCPLSKN